ncbi:Rcbtb2, partial [Symbiodinium sp. KB8]
MATTVAAGGAHSLVVVGDGTLRAFGWGISGQLGYGSTDNVGDMQNTLPIDKGPVPLGGLAAAVSAGDYHSVVLGNGDTENVGDQLSTLPSGQGVVNLGGEAVAVAAGASHTLVAMADGKAFAFGVGAHGRLGSGATDDIGDTLQTLPLLMGPVSLNGSAVAVAAGGSHSLVLLDDGSVLAFGSGGHGKLGYGNTLDVGHTLGTLPSKQGPVSLGGNATAVAAGGSHSLVLLDDGSVLAFGY